MNNNSSKYELKGQLTDNGTRCIHYHSALDIIAIKFKCCDVYYPCYECHAEEAGHTAQVWPKNDGLPKQFYADIAKKN